MKTPGSHSLLFFFIFLIVGGILGGIVGLALYAVPALKGILPALMLAFCDSPYLSQDRWEESLTELLSLF